jgi:hypothetical protein
MKVLLSIFSGPKSRVGKSSKLNEWHPTTDMSQDSGKTLVTSSSEFSHKAGQSGFETEDMTAPAHGQTPY